MTAPRPTRKPVVSRSVGLTEPERYQLFTGCDFFNEAYGREVHENPEALARMRADWGQYRDELLAVWVIENPRTRPFAWWVFDSPERRQTTDGSTHPFDRPERKQLAAEWHAQHPRVEYDRKFFELHYGRPNLVVGCYVDYETDEEYLTRLGLLLPQEMETPAAGFVGIE